jgi:hypothetical protein
MAMFTVMVSVTWYAEPGEPAGSGYFLHFTKTLSTLSTLPGSDMTLNSYELLELDLRDKQSNLAFATLNFISTRQLP